MLYDYPTYPESLVNQPKKMLSEIPTIHDNCVIIDSKLGSWTEVGCNNHLQEVTMQDYSYTDADVHMVYAKIGKFTSIARQVRINPSNHPQWRVTQHHCTYRAAMFGFADVDDADFFDWRRRHHCQIGHDVWLGHGVIVMPGVSIGNGAIVGAGAVVTKDIGDYEVAVGVPATVIKKRFDDEIIVQLQRIAWWHWDRQTLEERFSDLKDMDVFLHKYASP